MDKFEAGDLIVAVLGFDSTVVRGRVLDPEGLVPEGRYLIEAYADDTGEVTGRHLVSGLQIALVRRHS